jgi:hypothetical protein
MCWRRGWDGKRDGKLVRVGVGGGNRGQGAVRAGRRYRCS